MKKNLKFIWPIFTIALAVVIFFMMKSMISPKTPKSLKDSQTIGDNIDGLTVEDEKVDSDILKDYKLNFVNIWHTSCMPCVDEIPELQELSEEYKDKGVQFIGVLKFYQSESDILEAKDMLNTLGAKYTNIIPSEKMMTEFTDKFSAMPTTIFLDKDGKMVGNAVIGAIGKDNFKEEINKRLEMIDSNEKY
ncbi:MAG: TlpA family protein disulfide reductase [Tissierellia bacterium]|nr:TlpA family protein disulfide reductase [Tissierellia bacterium]